MHTLDLPTNIMRVWERYKLPWVSHQLSGSRAGILEKCKRVVRQWLSSEAVCLHWHRAARLCSLTSCLDTGLQSLLITRIRVLFSEYNRRKKEEQDYYARILGVKPQWTNINCLAIGSGHQFPVCVGGISQHIQAILWHQLGVLWFNSILTLLTQRWHQIPHVKGSIL